MSRRAWYSPTMRPIRRDGVGGILLSPRLSPLLPHDELPGVVVGAAKADGAAGGAEG